MQRLLVKTAMCTVDWVHPFLVLVQMWLKPKFARKEECCLCSVDNRTPEGAHARVAAGNVVRGLRGRARQNQLINAGDCVQFAKPIISVSL